MSVDQYWDRIEAVQDQFNSVIESYWGQYSHWGTWTFWTVLLMFLAPLVLLFFTVNRNRVFEVFFFGFVVHVLWTYTDIALERQNMLIHPYFLSPQLPYGLNITVSALPVGFLLLYQFCTGRGINFYLYSAVLSAVFAFGFASAELFTGFLELDRGLTRVHLFLIDYAIALLAYESTRLLNVWGTGQRAA